MKKLLVTGCDGFIGTNYLLQSLVKKKYSILNIDKNNFNQSIFSKFSNYKFCKINLLNLSKVKEVVFSFKPSAIIHFAADSHVDSSIENPLRVFHNNTTSTINLLNSILYSNINLNSFKFVYISTDEVYGSVEKKSFTENFILNPSSPYSASKASCEHIVTSYYKTYGIPYLITNCSNNFGPFQYPEKFIPLSIYKLLQGDKIPIYGLGDQIREWIYVKDHNEAINFLLEKAQYPQKYNIGSNNKLTNLNLAKKLIKIMNSKKLISKSDNYIEFIKDRPGHDKKYSINSKKINDLGWSSKSNFEDTLGITIDWYVENYTWLKKIIKHYNKGNRMGLNIRKI